MVNIVAMYTKYGLASPILKRFSYVLVCGREGVTTGYIFDTADGVGWRHLSSIVAQFSHTCCLSSPKLILLSWSPITKNRVLLDFDF